MAAATALLMLAAVPAAAQITPAAGYTPPDDTPSVTIGSTIFADYTYQRSPQTRDADGNTIHPSAFNIQRAYINVNGKVSHLFQYRITPDITRISNGDLELRLKYAFGQINLDDWIPRGSWVRFGQQQTPLLDFDEGIYRYRFQGTMFVEREGFLTSSDLGASFHGNFPSNYGDVHVGIYNGEGYHAAEANNQPSFQVRGTIRPLATASPMARGLRITGFYDADHYVKNGEKKRAFFEASFEHRYLHAAFDYLDTKDQTSITKADVHGNGWSIWATPKAPQAGGASIEGLLRYDHFTPNKSNSNQVHKRTIVGIAYWLPHTGGPQAAFLLDYDGARFENFGQADQKKVAVHMLVNF